MFILLFSLTLLLVVWFLFPAGMYLCQRLVNLSHQVESNPGQEQLPEVTVLIAALNEAHNLPDRISNIRACRYPSRLLKVLIVSDGSSDNTMDVITELQKSDEGLSVIENGRCLGRAESHNQGIQKITSDIVVFTDAETQFDVDFLVEIVRPFQSSKVGFVTGALGYRNLHDSDLQESVGLYWKLEQHLRIWETRLGLNVFGTGACCAVRTGLYEPIPATGDVDFTTPIDVVKAGYLCVHAENAKANDQLPETVSGEFKARVRMTSKNFHGMLSRWGWKNVLKKPVYTLTMLVHKYGRWMTPFFLLALLVSSVYVGTTTGNVLVLLLLAGQLLFYFAGAMGHFGIFSNALTNAVGNFLLANAGFLIGVIRVIKRDIRSVYTPISQTEKGA